MSIYVWICTRPIFKQINKIFDEKTNLVPDLNNIIIGYLGMKGFNKGDDDDEFCTHRFCRDWWRS